jgi:hypothetical protein
MLSKIGRKMPVAPATGPKGSSISLDPGAVEDEGEADGARYRGTPDRTGVCWYAGAENGEADDARYRGTPGPSAAVEASEADEAGEGCGTWTVAGRGNTMVEYTGTPAKPSPQSWTDPAAPEATVTLAAGAVGGTDRANAAATIFSAFGPIDGTRKTAP